MFDRIRLQVAEALEPPFARGVISIVVEIRSCEAILPERAGGAEIERISAESGPGGGENVDGHDGSGGEGVDELEAAVLEVGGVAGGEGDGMDEGGGGDEHVGGVSGEAPGGELAAEGAGGTSDGRVDGEDVAVVVEEVVEPLAFEGQVFPGEAEDKFFEGDDAEKESWLAIRPVEDLRLWQAAHEFADDVGIDEGTHGLLVFSEGSGGGRTGLGAGGRLELFFFRKEEGAESSEGGGNGFGLGRIR